MDPPGSHRVSRVRQYSGATRESSQIRVRGFYPVSPAFPSYSASTKFCNSTMNGPTTPPALAQLTVCPISPGYLYPAYIFSRKYQEMTLGGFTHSEIHGSQDMCSLPWLIAAYHVLHRLLVPRHPPFALTIFFSMV